MKEQEIRARLERVLNELDSGRETVARYARKLCVGGSVIAATVSASACSKDMPVEPDPTIDPGGQGATTSTAPATIATSTADPKHVPEPTPEYAAVAPPPPTASTATHVPEPVMEYMAVEPPPPDPPYMAPFG